MKTKEQIADALRDIADGVSVTHAERLFALAKEIEALNVAPVDAVADSRALEVAIQPSGIGPVMSQ